MISFTKPKRMAALCVIGVVMNAAFVYHINEPGNYFSILHTIFIGICIACLFINFAILMESRK